MLYQANEYKIIAQSVLTSQLKDEEIDLLRYDIPLRGLPKADRQSIMVLPRHPAVEGLKKLYESVLIGAELECIWTQDTHILLDLEIAGNEALLQEIIDRVNHKKARGWNISVCPYSYNENSAQWINRLPQPVKIYGDDMTFTERFRYKSIFHRHIKTPELPCEMDHVPGLHIPRGYLCDDAQDIYQAYLRLRQQGVEQFVVKPITGSSGRGITRLRSEEEVLNYGFPEEETVIFCESVRHEQNAINEINCSVEYYDLQIFGPPSSQIIEDTSWAGGLVPPLPDKGFSQDALRQAGLLLDYLVKNGMKGLGGIDFMGTSEKAYLIDNNLTRETGSHFPKYFQYQYAPGRPFAAARIKENPRSAFDYWEALQQQGLAFDKNKGTGVFPMDYIPGVYAMVIAFADNSLEAYKQIKKAEELLS